ncbi:MAG: hypothetical protein NC928_05325 [Candidatus Omnitrophica bacterium]|nr:hypothetical protein [Candidatus Omnitrophota bacterium]
MRLKKIRLPFKLKKSILALGSHMKNTICFASGRYAYLSCVNADLNNPQDLLNFEKTAKYFLKKEPQVIVCDLHPEYQSTKFAHRLRLNICKLQFIQHHHAHIASCMAENGLKNQDVIGVAFDGTGLGSNHHLWGAEFFICDYRRFKRTAHLREIPLLGGEMAISEPWRLVVMWLYLLYKEHFLDLKINFLKGIKKEKWQVLKKMYRLGFNAPLSSSMGRLFDAVASLVLGQYKTRFEAELAIKWERLATGYSLKTTGYRFAIVKDKDGYVVDPLPIFKEIIRDLKIKEPMAKIAYKFHLSVAEIIKRICRILREETRINKVILSGGVFQNNLLLNLILDLLYKDGFEVLRHKEIPCNDSGISLGQAVIANFTYPGNTFPFEMETLSRWKWKQFLR